MSNGVKALGKAIRACRRSKLLTQDDLADGAGIKITTLRNIETGRVHAVPQTIRKIARALGCEAQELLPSIPAGKHDMLALTSPQNPAAFLAAQITRTDLMMDRRAALKVAILAGASLLNPVESWVWEFEQSAGRQPVRFAPERHHDVEKLEEAARLFRELGRGSGGGTYRTTVVTLLNEVASLFEDNGLPTAVKQHLYRIMADLADIAAEMSWDCGLEGRAQEYYRLALHCAYEGGDFVSGANVLASMARQLIYLGHAHDALDLIRLAKQRVDTTTDPRVLAMLDTREAWAFAALGRVPAFQRATMQAREHFSAAPMAGGPYWIAYFNDAELSGVTGGRLMELARHSPKEYAEDAVAEISHALQSNRIKTGRTIALDQIALAECYFLLGDTVTAVQQAHRALNALDCTQSRRPLVQLRELFQQAKRAPQGRAVVDVQGRIRDALTNRESTLV